MPRILLFVFLVFTFTATLRALPLAEGKTKWLGCVYSAPQAEGFAEYWNQVVPENAGKWGSVEGTRDVMNWGPLDEAYATARENGFPFRFHVLVWGSQQPNWVETLPPEEQLEEIEEWFAAVAERYPDMEYVEVVNEPVNAPPDADNEGKYIEALGGAGETGWDWIITSFEMARRYFPNSALVMNEYGVISDGPGRTTPYLEIIELLDDRGLIDVIGFQGHSFSIEGGVQNMETQLERMAAFGLPIIVTEMDVDGDDNGVPDGAAVDEASDALQLERYQRVFPLFWEHPSVIGVTLWGFRPGNWREDTDAFIVLTDGTERPAMTWLREYVTTTRAGSYLAYLASQGRAGEAVAPESDEDSDGLSAVVEYWLGTRLGEADTPFPFWDAGTGGPRLRVPVRDLSQGYLLVESSTDLNTWTEAGSFDLSNPEGSNVTLDETGESPVLEFTGEAGDAAVRFFRKRLLLDAPN